MNKSTTPNKSLTWEEAVTWLVEQPDREAIVRECYFDRPVDAAVRRYANSEEWAEVSKWLPTKIGRALDVGAGNGIVSFALAQAGWRVTALEPDPSQYVGAEAVRAIAQDNELPIEVVQTWGEAMPFPDNHFELVVARQVIHHAHDLKQMYAEMARVLRPGGTLIAFRDHVIDSPEGLEEFRRNHPLHHLYGGENAFTLAQYRAAIQECGLKIIRQWNQFDSVINYAPLTRQEMCRKFSQLLPLRPLQPAIAGVLQSPFVFPILTKLASRFNRKQGRAVSFLIHKSMPS